MRNSSPVGAMAKTSMTASLEFCVSSGSRSSASYVCAGVAAEVNSGMGTSLWTLRPASLVILVSCVQIAVWRKDTPPPILQLSG